jgi:hypothetical protein
MGESFDRNIKQASLQTVTTHRASGDGGRGGGGGKKKAYKQNRVSKHRRVLTQS